MIFVRPTRYGSGAELLGDELDLRMLYDVLHQTATERVIASQLLDYMLCLAYDVRKAKDGQRETVKLGYDQELTYRSVKITWPALLIQVGMYRWAAKFQPTTARQHSALYGLESQIETALAEYDPVIGPQVYEWFAWFDGFSNNYLIQYLYELDRRYLELPNGKRRFKQLLPLLRSTSMIGKEYKTFAAEMEMAAQREGCSAHGLHIRYDDEVDFKW